MLDERLIIMDADVETAEDCIRLMGKYFEEYGYVKEGYADAVVEREKNFPTGLPGKVLSIAIPHTNNQLVNKPVIGILVPKQPVEFCMMGNKNETVQCSIIIPLVIQDSHQQIGLLKKMTKIIKDGELLTKVKKAKSKDEIMNDLAVLNE